MASSVAEQCATVCDGFFAVSVATNIPMAGRKKAHF